LQAEHLRRRGLVRKTFFVRRMRLTFLPAPGAQIAVRRERSIGIPLHVERFATWLFVTIWHNKTKKKLFLPTNPAPSSRVLQCNVALYLQSSKIDCCSGKRRVVMVVNAHSKTGYKTTLRV
jgi:hypothetical protein